MIYQKIAANKPYKLQRTTDMVYSINAYKTPLLRPTKTNQSIMTGVPSPTTSLRMGQH